MLHARLLPVVLATAAALCCGVGCVLPSWRPAVRGRVVDELTGRSVPGVQVRLLYQTRVVEGSSRDLEPPVLTDANGEFFVAGHLRIVLLRPLAAAESGPAFAIAYPPYTEPLICCYRVERSEPGAYTLTVCGSRPCHALRPPGPPGTAPGGSR